MHLTNLITTAMLAGTSIAFPTFSLSKRQNQPFTGPYTVTAHRPGHPIDNQPIQAAGQHFYIGGNPASYCPTVVGSACPNTTATVLAGGGLYVEVPGGQQPYTQTGGAAAFTQAHSISTPGYNTSFGGALANGSFVAPFGAGLAACPTPQQGANGTEYTAWQLFFEIPSFNRTDCVCFVATAANWTGGYGAWQYI